MLSHVHWDLEESTLTAATSNLRAAIREVHAPTKVSLRCFHAPLSFGLQSPITDLIVSSTADEVAARLRTAFNWPVSSCSALQSFPICYSEQEAAIGKVFAAIGAVELTVKHDVQSALPPPALLLATASWPATVFGHQSASSFSAHALSKPSVNALAFLICPHF